MKKSLCSSITLMLIHFSVFAQTKFEWKEVTNGNHTYKTVTNDPLKTRYYTLKNGLTVILSVNKAEPRLQTMIATKAGSNTDPANHTGLAHYLEHMLFKGTDHYGSLDWQKESPYLDKIDALYEQYNSSTDETARKEIYRNIDSVSGIAAKYAIANEYDKMMSLIGAKGTNAFTSTEVTCYINDIPSNQIDKWLLIEAERFRKPIFRLFHTELEAVYEEKNRGLDNDNRKVYETMMAALFQKHNYGQQTTLGTIEHLKNPSLKEIRNYFYKYYVPNNMCMILVGDFNPDEVIEQIDGTFGSFQSKEVSPYIAEPEPEITAPIEKTVYGPKEEWLEIGFRFPGANTKEAGMLQFMDRMFANGTAGLMDLNIVKKQKALQAYTYPEIQKDYSVFVLGGNPKQGQTLEDVKTLLLEQVENLKKGNFDDDLVQAVKNNFQKEQQQNSERNANRANIMLDAFITNVSWKDALSFYDEVNSYTKQDIVAFANKWLNNNYVVVYKRTGEDKSIIKVEKPPIHEVEVNRNAQSKFVEEITKAPVKPIVPMFLDFNKDIQKTTANGVQVIATPNNDNQLFSLYYYFDFGKNNLKKLPLALDYLKFVGTDKYSAEQISMEFYKLAADFSVNVDERNAFIQLNGLQNNFDKSVELLEHLLATAKPDQTTFGEFINDVIKNRDNSKLEKYNILEGLDNIGKYGIKNPFNNQFSNDELKKLTAEDLVAIIKSLTSYQHKILYYGPNTVTSATVLPVYHKPKLPLKSAPLGNNYVFRKQLKNEVNFANYDMVQSEISWNRNSSLYNAASIPVINLHNEYFGGGMSGIVFQTIRESKALAYSTYAYYGSAYKTNEPNHINAYVGCQADKMNEAISGMKALLDSLPYSEKLFSVTKDALKNNYATSRIIKQRVLFTYLDALRHGINYDVRQKTYAALDKLVFTDILKFHQQNYSRKPYSISIIANDKKINLADLNKYGKVTTYSLSQIFGY
ncbi:MAG: insulinase family protein [Chitinophagales bacterium]